MKDNNRELKIGIILSYVSLFVENVIPLFYTPWMLATMGTSEYGLYNLSHSVIGYLSLLSVGLGSAIIKFLSDKISCDDKDGENQLTGLFTVVYLIIGAISLVTGLFIAANTYTFFGKSLTNSELIRLQILLVLSTINTAATFPLTVYNALIIAHQKFIFNKSLGLLFTVASPVLNIVVLLSGARSIGLVLIATVLNIASGSIKVIYCFTKLKVRPQFRKLDFSPLKPIYKYSFFIFLGEISSMLYWGTDKVLLGAFCGTAVVSVYSVGASLNTYYCAFSTAISNVMFPKVNTMVQKNASDAELSEIFIKVGRIQYLLMCLITTGFILFGQQFIVLVWGGPSYRNAYFIALMTMIPSLIPLIQNIGLSIIQAKSKHQFRTVCFFIIALANILFSWVLVQKYGMIGCAIPTCVAFLIGQGMTMNWYYWKKINLDIPRFWKNILQITLPVIPLSLVSAVLIAIFKIETRFSLFSGIIIYSFAYAFLVWKFSMNPSEKGLFLTIIKPIVRKAKRFLHKTL